MLRWWNTTDQKQKKQKLGRKTSECEPKTRKTSKFDGTPSLFVLMSVCKCVARVQVQEPSSLFMVGRIIFQLTKFPLHVRCQEARKAVERLWFCSIRVNESVHVNLSLICLRTRRLQQVAAAAAAAAQQQQCVMMRWNLLPDTSFEERAGQKTKQKQGQQKRSAREKHGNQIKCDDIQQQNPTAAAAAAGEQEIEQKLLRRRLSSCLSSANL